MRKLFLQTVYKAHVDPLVRKGLERLKVDSPPRHPRPFEGCSNSLFLAPRRAYVVKKVPEK